MPILMSPGCNCSCECLLIEEADYSQEITADTQHEIPHTIPINCVADLTNLVPGDFFRDESNILKVHIKNSAGTVTHKTLTLQSVRDNSTFFELDEKEWEAVPYFGKFSYQPGAFNLRDGTRAYKRYIEVNDGTTDFETQAILKQLYVGEKLFRIKSVTAGTFDPEEGSAYSRINQSTALETACSPPLEHDGIISLEKANFMFLDTDATQTFKLIRYSSTSACDGITTDTQLNFYARRQSTVWNSGVKTGTVTFTEDLTSQASWTVRYAGTQYPAGCTDVVTWQGSSTVTVVPSASATGDGHFKLETTRVLGIAGQSTQVKVYRTGGNSTAVDVVVAVGNSDSTLSFAPGDVYKEFTISHDSHDGVTFTAGMIPTNDATVVRNGFQPLELIFRKDTFEIGYLNSAARYPIRKSGGYEVWDDKIPFERTGWTNSPVRIHVESNIDITLREYKIYEIKHEAHCDLAGDNGDCPSYDTCGSVAEYHSQQFDIECDLGVPSAYMPSLAYTLNEGCSSSHVFWNERLPRQIRSKRIGGPNLSYIYQDDEWRFLDRYGPSGQWNVSFNVLTLVIAEANRMVRCYDDTYWNSQESSTTINLSCGAFVDSTDFSSMPRACSAFGTIEYCIAITCGDSYTDGTIVSTALPVGDLPDFAPQTHEYATSCYDVTQCTTASLSSDNGINKVEAKATAVRSERFGIITGGPFDLPPASGLPTVVGDRLEIYNYATEDSWTNVWEYESTGWKFVGQEFPLDYVFGTTGNLTPSQIATEVDFLQSGGADYWFEYSNATDPVDDGFYRVTYSSSLSGPFSTADDGTGNVFGDVTQQVGIKAAISVDYFHSWLNTEIGTNPCNADEFGALTIFWPQCPETGFTQNEVSGVSYFSGTFVLSEDYYKDVEYAICEDPTNTSQIKIDGLMPEINGEGLLTTFGKYGTIDDGYRIESTYQKVEFTEGSSSVDWPSRPYYSPCSPTVGTFTSLSVAPPCPEVDAGYSLKYVDDANQPNRVTGTCSSTTNSAESICCDEAAPVSQIISWEYWDYDSLSDWSGQITGTGEGKKESLTAFFTTVETPIPFYSNGYRGLTSLTLKTATWTFPAKWGDCYTGMDIRQESFDGSTDDPDGPDRVFAFRSIGAGAAGEPYFSQLNGTSHDDPFSLVIDIAATANIIEKQNLTMTAKAYSTTWQKY